VASGLPVVNFIYSEKDPSYLFLNPRFNYVFQFNLNNLDQKGFNDLIRNRI
jgi:hypothetical protein